MQKVRWGVLSTAKIGRKQVIPALQQSKHGRVTALASRTLEHARAVADELGIDKAYASYEALLADPEVDAIYNPLPNHLHVPWTIQALAAGKHVLCEKPIGLSSAEARQLLETSQQYPHLKVMEAFMYRHHPQWQWAQQAVLSGKIGRLQTIQSFFSYHNVDPHNIRNDANIGGGGLMDIGCYCISLARFLFGSEPERVWGMQQLDPGFHTDYLFNGVLDFGQGGTSTFTCSTQLAPYQRVNILGTQGRIEIEIPFNAPPNQPARLWHSTQGQTEAISFEICDQYTLQGDRFAQAILNDTPVPTPLADAIANMVVIEALVASAQSGHWSEIG